MTSQIVKENVAGIITEVGGKTSHSAILARALEIPAVLSVPDITSLVKDKDTAVVDGTEGIVYINPDGDILSQYIIKREEYIKKFAELKTFHGKKTVTSDGTKLELFCNIGTPKDAKKAIECDGDFAEAYFNRGLTYIYTDQLEQGLQDLSKAGELGIYQAYNLITRFQ